MTSDTKNQENGRVIITYGRSLMALTAAHSLGKRGIEVIGCDDVNMTVLNFSKYVDDFFIHAPYQDDVERYLDDLETNIRAFKPDDDRPYILMPMFRDTKILAQHRERFEGLITIAAPEFDAINQVNPKDIFAQTCKRLNLTIPETRRPDNIQTLERMKNDLEFPLLTKPVDDIGGRGIHIANTYDELKQLYQDSIKHYDAPPLIQDVINGEDYCLSALCDNGKIVAHMAYKNLHQFPRDSGAGIMRETIDDAPFMDTASKLLKALNWHGVAQIDFRWSGDENDPAYLIEVNPRFWAGLFHSVESGVDFPWLLYQLTAFGEVTDKPDINIGAITKVPGLWTLSAIQDIAESETHFDQLKNTWNDIWDDNNNTTWRKKFDQLSESLKNSIDGKDIVDKLKTMRKTGQNAKSEIDTDDDPLTGLGLLFIASSLLRHGKLPPEIKS